MRSYTEARCQKVGRYIVEHHATVRQTAKVFGISKSTVFEDANERLRRCNLKLYREVAKVFAKNKAERHIRGGQATKAKYKK